MHRSTTTISASPRRSEPDKRDTLVPYSTPHLPTAQTHRAFRRQLLFRSSCWYDGRATVSIGHSWMSTMRFDNTATTARCGSVKPISSEVSTVT